MMRVYLVNFLASGTCLRAFFFLFFLRYVKF
jgi:hypothetical protein